MDLIIGAGVSGIAYANFSKNRCSILEKENEVGGYCRTVKRNNFVWDYSGHFFHFQNKDMEEYVCKNIPKANLRSVKKDTSILYNNQYVDFPFQKNIHQLPKPEFIDCLFDLFVADKSKETTSFKDMVYNNLGKSIADKFLIPYNEKLYACNLDLLDKEAMGRFFPKASKEDIILNFKSTNAESYNQYFVYPKGGAIEYINSLADNIHDTTIDLNEEVLSIDILKKEVVTTRRVVQYDNLISTMPFPMLLKKCNIEHEDVFTCNKVLVFNIGFNKKGKDMHTSWLYIPSKEFVFYRVGFYDNIMQSDRLSMYVEIGFKEHEELQSNDFYFDKIISDLKLCKIIDDEEIVDHEAVLMNPAYVHINPKSTELLYTLKQDLAKHDIYSIGRYGSWTYCSIEDNIIEAKELATKLSKII